VLDEESKSFVVTYATESNSNKKPRKTVKKVVESLDSIKTSVMDQEISNFKHYSELCREN